MGMRIDQAGYPGLDPAAGTASGVSIARRVGSSPPATPQFASMEAPTPAGADAAHMDAAEVESTLEGINARLAELGSSLSLNFIHDEASGRSAVQIVDENGEVIRQVPPQELLDVYAKIRNIVGILLDESG